MRTRSVTIFLMLGLTLGASLSGCSGSSGEPQGMPAPTSASVTTSPTPKGSAQKVAGEQTGSLVLAGLTGARSGVVKAVAPSTETLVVRTSWGSTPSFVTRLGSDDKAGTLMSVGTDVFLAKPTRPGKWMKVDLAGKDASSSTVLPLLFGLFVQDPGAVPLWLKGAQGSCTPWSDGSHKCEFPMTTDTLAARSTAILAARGVPADIIGQYLKSVSPPKGTAVRPLVIVMDAQNRPTSIETPQSASASSTPSRVDVELWGSPVGAERPQPSAIMPADQWIGQ